MKIFFLVLSQFTFAESHDGSNSALATTQGFLQDKMYEMQITLGTKPIEFSMTLNLFGYKKNEKDYAKLQSIKDNSKISEFTTDGCSGNVSHVWDNFIVPTFSKGFKSLGKEDKVMKLNSMKFPVEQNCCVPHDKAYWAGHVDDPEKLCEGRKLSKAQYSHCLRALADYQFYQCIRNSKEQINKVIADLIWDDQPKTTEEEQKKFNNTLAQVSKLVDSEAIARTMYVAVRNGGRPCTGESYRWGYGYPLCE